MKTVTEKRYFVTTKFEKYGTYTFMARSKEHAIEMYKDGDWNVQIILRIMESTMKS